MLKTPLVSCLMVTSNRKKIARRAVECFMSQTYKNKELVVLDDGDECYQDMLNDICKNQYRYLKIRSDNKMVLGALRNISLEEARGDYIIQWDDDDWYHPERIEIQAKFLDNGFYSCFLGSCMTHISTRDYRELPFIGKLSNGIPGTIMHVKDDSIKYPEIRKSEDTDYLNKWLKLKYYSLPDNYAYLFIRTFHGNNTWDLDHFKRRAKNSIKDYIMFYWHKDILRDIKKNPKFNLDDRCIQSFKLFKQQSEELGILC